MTDDVVDIDRAPAGHHWTWVVDEGWRVIPDDVVRSCRYGASPGHPACGALARVELNRPRHGRHATTDSWWAYCSTHMYGRRIIDGKVHHRVLRPDDPEAGH